MRERINYLHCLSPRGQRIATVRRTEVSAESWTTGADVCYFFDLKSIGEEHPRRMKNNAGSVTYTLHRTATFNVT